MREQVSTCRAKGLEQTIVPLIGKSEFSIESSAIIVSFIASFESVNAIK